MNRRSLMKGRIETGRPVAVVAALFMGAWLSLAAQTPTLVLSAASSLTDVLNAVKPEAEKRLGVSILMNYGASGSLRAQIEQGAPADLFFSAAAADVDKLEKAGLLVSGSRRNLVGNSLVLVGAKAVAKPAYPAELKILIAGARLLAVGNPDSVPAGRYGVEALKSHGLYVSVEGKLAFGGTVREVLQFVESGSVPLGIVFKTDALSLKPGSPIGVLYEFPDGSAATPIVYPIAVVAATKRRDLALKLAEFLAGPYCAEAYRKAGFLVK
jgi:molybdate transport system substrate-binding protein